MYFIYANVIKKKTTRSIANGRFFVVAITMTSPVDH